MVRSHNAFPRWVRSPEQIHGAARPGLPSSVFSWDEGGGPQYQEIMPGTLPKASLSSRDLGSIGLQENEPFWGETQWLPGPQEWAVESHPAKGVHQFSRWVRECMDLCLLGSRKYCRVALKGQRAKDGSGGSVRAAGQGAGPGLCLPGESHPASGIGQRGVLFCPMVT